MTKFDMVHFLCGVRTLCNAVHIQIICKDYLNFVMRHIGDAKNAVNSSQTIFMLKRPNFVNNFFWVVFMEDCPELSSPSSEVKLFLNLEYHSNTSLHHCYKFAGSFEGLRSSYTTFDAEFDDSGLLWLAVHLVFVTI